jgi:hypothetical protein
MTVTYAQNLQLHYETDKGRQYPIAMLESFTFDDWGGTYWFVSFEFTNPLGQDERTLSLAYGEIARYINIKPFETVNLSVQYNDGVAWWGPMGRAWMFGLSYPFPLETGSLQIDVLSRFTANNIPMDGQVTVAWFFPFGESPLQFVGYWDIWSETEVDNEKHLVMLAEPQLWYQVWNNLDLGLGAEVSYNFPSFLDAEWKLYPNLSARWNF